ncbi:GvpL/GvpF family gas vesicle protein [Streptomyces spiralis]|uniref:GvpL/GvpF family gas vesicle protein n=1 Tax=Streptomyces spiralis TaxID=66376 RepID=UPI0036C4758B
MNGLPPQDAAPDGPDRLTPPQGAPGGRDPLGRTLIYVFAVTGAPPAAGLPAAAAGHEEGGPLRVLQAGALWLLAQDVPASAFTETALAERLNRPEELERCARAHHRGVEAAARQGPVVPLPMATLYASDTNAVEAVTARAPEFGALLDRLRDRTEWAVKVHATAPPAAAPQGAPPVCEGGPPGGRAYLSRASARRRIRHEAHEQAVAQAMEVDRELRQYAVAATRYRPQSERLSGRGTPQLLNAAYLVDDAGQGDFTRVLARAATGRPHVDIIASGPWVPYSFARPDQEWGSTAREEVGA